MTRNDRNLILRQIFNFPASLLLLWVMLHGARYLVDWLFPLDAESDPVERTANDASHADKEAEADGSEAKDARPHDDGTGPERDSAEDQKTDETL